jgi:hypothetical protein
MTRISHQDLQPQSAAYNSLGLNALLRPLEIGRKYAILDLGPALSASVAFWSQFHCRLTINDFYGDYRARLAAAPDAATEELLTELLSFAPVSSFDVILTWDLFNYLDEEELGMFIRRLTRWCRRGTVLFALISSLPSIPSQPNLFRIVDRERLTYQARTREMQTCPRHQPRDLARLMARFEVSCSIFMRSGIQEYVFTYVEDGPPETGSRE